MTDVLLLRDLIVVVPDADMEFVVRSLLSRPADLGICPIAFDLWRHVQRDAGCRSDCHNLLRSGLNKYRYAMVLFDHEGSGRETTTREKLEGEVEKILRANGWQDRGAVIVIYPELEAWVWSDSLVVDEVLGWTGRTPPLRPWIKSATEFWHIGQAKPECPKEAFDAALRQVGKRHSPSVFEDLAAQINVEHCIDPAFGKFKSILQSWFGC